MKITGITLVLAIFLGGCDLPNSPLFYRWEGKVNIPIYAEDIFNSSEGDELAKAIVSGDYKKLTAILGQTNIVHETGIYGITPLWLAVSEKDRKAAQILLNHGADPNAPVTYVEPIMIEASKGKAKLLQILLESGGDPNTTYMSSPCLYYAVSPMIFTEYFSKRKIDALLKAGADINLQTSGDDRKVSAGQTPIMLLTGPIFPVSVVTYLLDKGADLTIKDIEDRTIVDHLDFCSEAFNDKQRYTSVYRWLKDHGYNLDELRNPKWLTEWKRKRNEFREKEKNDPGLFSDR